MGKFLAGFLLPLLLLAAAMLDWSLIPLVNLLAFFVVQYTRPKGGFQRKKRSLLLWSIVLFSILVISAQSIFYIIWIVKGKEQSISDAWWAKLVGFIRIQPWGSTSVVYFFVIQLAIALIAYLEVYENRFGWIPRRDSCWWSMLSSVEQLGSHLRVACCLLLPVVQLVVGISHPSWISLPFFICSCVGLVDWSLTSNFLGLFRWWRLLFLYAGFSILMLYVYQLPINFPGIFLTMAKFIGLYKVYGTSEWGEVISGISLVVFYFMLSSVKYDMDEMDSIMSMHESSLTEQLLPSKSGVRHTNVLLRGSVFRNFSINFFTYGFPVSNCRCIIAQ
ncbi:hypothetical protein QJS10_CPB04g00741 [Acorus calamus]|uniref:Piezo-type mechanosensitive ion channel homolog n=1 Tax=Acorus calamus TaxID=4465 RepID=A0AAV9F2Q1_ACOCL|nr:hypothetical protein QJS10_CPB04g00741 [Acorus calamus]